MVGLLIPKQPNMVSGNGCLGISSPTQLTMNTISNSIRLILISLFVSIPWIANAHDIIPGKAQSAPIFLTNGTIHTVSGETLANSGILFDNGIITAIGNDIKAPRNAETIDLDGRHVYPGLISSLSSLGLVEINAVRATRDYMEVGPINPNAKAATAINPDSEVIPVTRANGVLISHVLPQVGGGFIGGTSVTVALDGWTIEEMALKSPTGIHARWPRSSSPRPFHPNNAAPANESKAEETYQSNIRKLDAIFDDARTFLKAKENGSAEPDVNLRWEAMIPVLKKEIPLIIATGNIREIRDAVNWATREDIEFVIVAGADAWRVADFLKENDVKVIVSGVNSLPRRRWESYDTVYTNTVKLHEKGVPFAIAFGGGGPNVSNERNLPYDAAKAAAHGLPKDEALKAITLYPAQILGIDDKVGSLEVGKHATLIVTTGDPLDIRTNVEKAYIQGRAVDLSSRHTQLYEKYQNKYEE